MIRIPVIDSHTAGEPTRVVTAGAPDLAGTNAAAKLADLRANHDRFRAALVNEPRGSDPLVGALLLPPSTPDCAAGVIFFNNVGYLGMCVHGTIGVVTTLAHLGRLRPGRHAIETPVGIVTVCLHEDSSVAVTNVPSYRLHRGVTVPVGDGSFVHGDVAWGGNWFFLCEDHGQALAASRRDELTEFSWRIRQALARAGIRAPEGAEIDHIELFGPPHDAAAHSRNFVLCPGKAYDRSPCGTGTSAKLACLYEDGKLKEGEIWRQESIIGSIFEGSVAIHDGRVYPTLRGRAHITAEATLILDDIDPYCWGISA